MNSSETMISSSPGPELWAWLRLTLEPGVGTVTAKQLLAAFGLPEHIFAASYSQLMPVVGQKLALQLSTDCAPEIGALIERTFDWLAKPEHYIITLADAAYPASLLETHDPPVLLYVDGQLESLAQTHKMAMVGARHATVMGESNARAFAKYLAQKGWCIVSGLALGIDAASHEGALDSLCVGSTIAVMGTGINRLYPAQHKQLALRIKAQGALISELPLDTSAKAFHFPQRNRLVAGLSRGVLVVEAAKQSGSLITVDYAQEQHKKILAVPGSIFNETSAGCNSLIYDGCDPFLGKQDLYDFLNIIKKGGENNNKNDIKMDLLKKIGKEPIHIDKIIGSVNIDRTALFELLFEMQNENEIICLPGNYYVKIR